MKPERARELFSDYAEDALTPALRLALDQHFAADPAARAEYEQFFRIYALLEAHEPAMVEVPLGFRAKVLENVAAEQARREAAPAHRAAQSLTGWWKSIGSRRAGAGVFAALAACAIVGVIVAHPMKIDTGGPVLDPTPIVLTTITGVNYTPPDPSGASHYNFQIHLPFNVPSATVSADILTSNDQITDADDRVANATPALMPAQTLTNDESMEIPVTLPHSAAAGTTLNMLVLWAPSNGGPSGGQIVFTPAQPVPATPKPLPSVTDFYDALQYVAAADGVTVIADATNAPTQGLTPPTSTNAYDQLQSIAAQVGDKVQQVAPNTYQVYTPQ